MKVPTVAYWAGNWGDFRLPDDFPTSFLRVNGWFDRRFGIHRKMSDYINEQDDKLRTGDEKPGFAAPSWFAWIVCGSTPNRLHGAAINERGEAI